MFVCVCGIIKQNEMIFVLFCYGYFVGLNVHIIPEHVRHADAQI